MELPKDCESVQNQVKKAGEQRETDSGKVEQKLIEKLQHFTKEQLSDDIWKYGEEKNKREIEKKISKLMLCVVMENWEKAEGLAENIKALVEEAPKEVKSAALRMKMAVQKGNIQKATQTIEKLQKIMEDDHGDNE